QLPSAIKDELDSSTIQELDENIKIFKRELLKYEGERWTRPGAVNKPYVQELKKTNLEAYPAIQARYKGADRIRITARVATKIFEDIPTIVERGESARDEEDLLRTIEKARRLAVYGFATKDINIGEAQDEEDLTENQHFKMEGISALRDLLEPNDLMAKIDLKDTYTVVPIHPSSRKYLSFEHHG
ncbi:hypothetical protein BDA99DRAFT_418980, partial [Phascolomyces articulosus]